MEFPSGGQIEAMKSGGDVRRIGDFVVTAINLVTVSQEVSQAETHSGRVLDVGAANWRCSEFSAVSSKGVVEEEGAEEEGQLLN